MKTMQSLYPVSDPIASDCGPVEICITVKKKKEKKYPYKKGKVNQKIQFRGRSISVSKNI